MKRQDLTAIHSIKRSNKHLIATFITTSTAVIVLQQARKTLGWLLCTILLVVSTLLPIPLSAQNVTQQKAQEHFIPITHEAQLNNGLKIFIREDHRAPIAIFQIWYGIGSSYEPEGKTGISHMLEHMMFKGTTKVPPEAFSKLIAAYGGSGNAFTSRDFTAYYQKWEVSRLPLSFELEADRMQQLHITEEHFAKEHQVVLEERRLRIEDQPTAKFYERFLTTAYTTSNYQQPIIGWMHDLEQLTVADLQHWYQTWYAPNNAIIVVVGSVDPDQVIQLAQTHFGHIPKRKLPAVKLLKEVPALGKRTIAVHLEAKLPHLILGYNVPSVATADTAWEPYALFLLAGILDGGYSARIERQLIREQRIANRAGASYNPFSRGDTLFVLNGIPAPPHSLDTLEQSFYNLLQNLKKQLADPKELFRIKSQLAAEQIYLQDTISRQAYTIGQLETIGLSWRDYYELLAQIKAISAEQIQQVADKYLTPNRLTVARLLPKSPKNVPSKSPTSVILTEGSAP